MSTFDPITYAAVQRLNKQIGEIVLVPNSFSNDSYVDSGTFVNANDFPKLADSCKLQHNIAELQAISLPTIAGNSGISPSVGVRFNSAIVGSDVYFMDTAFRIFKTDTLTSSWSYVGIINDYVDTSYGSFLYFAGRFLYITVGAILQSDDCITWKAATDFPVSSASRASIANGYLFIVPSASSNVIYSTSDCSTWSTLTMPSQKTWGDVVYNGSVYVVPSISGLTNAAYSSDPTTSTWSAVTLPTASNSITAFGDTLLSIPFASGTAGYKSTNASTWSAVTLPISILWTHTFVTDSSFIIGCANGIYASASAATASWTLISSALSGASTRSIATNIFYGLGNTHKYYNTLNSTLENLPAITLAATATARGITSNTIATLYLDKFNDSIWRTTNGGTSWSEIVLPNGFVPATLGYVALIDTFFITGPDTSTGFLSSTNSGETWVSGTIPAVLTGVTTADCSDRKMFAVQGFAAGSIKLMLWTRDGINWNSFSMNVATNNVTQICFFTNKVIALKDNNYHLMFKNQSPYTTNTYTLVPATSIDSSLTSAFALKSAAANDHVAVVVGGYITSSTKPSTSNIFWTDNGQFWTAVTLPDMYNSAAWDSVFWTGDYFVALPSRTASSYLAISYTVATSANGKDWVLVDLTKIFAFSNGDSRGLMKIFVNDGCVFLSVDGMHKIYKVNAEMSPWIDYVETGIPGTKYAVKAKE